MLVLAVHDARHGRDCVVDSRCSTYIASQNRHLALSFLARLNSLRSPQLAVCVWSRVLFRRCAYRRNDDGDLAWLRLYFEEVVSPAATEQRRLATVRRAWCS